MGIKNSIQKTFYNIGANLGLLKKSAPFMWPVNIEGQVQWQMGNFLNYTQNGFAINSIIYSTIMYKVRAVTQAIPRAVTGNPLNPDILPPNHPLSKLAKRPNPYMSWIEMQALLQCYLNISGNAYLIIDREKNANGIPQAIYPVRPDEMFIIPSEGGLSGYLYMPRSLSIKNAIPILLDDVIHIKFPNPSDTFQGLGYGLSPMSPLSQTTDVDNSVTRYLKLFFDRGAMPVGLLKYDIPLDLSMINTIKNRWRQIYGGVDNWTDIGVLDSGGQYQKLGQSFDEMGFEGLDERNESRIIGPFGVPPILIGTRFGLSSSTYSNYEHARKSFWEDTMMFEIRLFEAEIQYQLMGNDDSYLIYDTSAVTALRPNILPLVDAAKKLWDMGVPANQALVSVGLNLSNIPMGDIPYVPLNVAQAGVKKEQEKKVFENLIEIEKKIEIKKKDFQSNELLEILISWEEEFKKGAIETFDNNLKYLLALIKKLSDKSLVIKSSINWSDILDPYDAYLNGDSELIWRNKFVPLLSAVINDVGNFWSVELGTSFNLRNLLAEDWFQNYTLAFAQPINSTTSDFIHEIIAQAQAEGWSNQQLQNRLKTSFQQWQLGNLTPEDFEWLKTRIPDYRAEMIARTETTRAANGGSQGLFSSWGIEKKEWRASIDGRERETHASANGQIVNINDSFLIGGFNMMFPGDPNLGAPRKEYVNCRCTILPIIENN